MKYTLQLNLKFWDLVDTASLSSELHVVMLMDLLPVYFEGSHFVNYSVWCNENYVIYYISIKLVQVNCNWFRDFNNYAILTATVVEITIHKIWGR